jgi:hypothetical protein
LPSSLQMVPGNQAHRVAPVHAHGATPWYMYTLVFAFSNPHNGLIETRWK